jgi:hypothetical protein
MDTLVGEFFMHVLGRIVLNVRYRSKEKIRKILDEKYAGSYSNAARVYSIYIFAIPFGILLFGLLIIGLISIFKI